MQKDIELPVSKNSAQNNNNKNNILGSLLPTQWRLAVCAAHRLMRIEIRRGGSESCNRFEAGSRFLHSTSMPLRFTSRRSRASGTCHLPLGFCRKAPGRTARHHALNDLVAQSFASAGTPGLFCTDGKRPDGVTLVPWQWGRSLCWDVSPAPWLNPIRHWVHPRCRCCSRACRFPQGGKVCQHRQSVPLRSRRQAGERLMSLS